MSEAAELTFYKKMQTAVRAEAGKALSPLLKRWRYTQSSDFGALELDVATARFLIRYGTLDAGHTPEKRTDDFRRMLVAVSRATGDAPGVVAAWMKLFASGE